MLKAKMLVMDLQLWFLHLLHLVARLPWGLWGRSALCASVTKLWRQVTLRHKVRGCLSHIWWDYVPNLRSKATKNCLNKLCNLFVANWTGYSGIERLNWLVIVRRWTGCHKQWEKKWWTFHLCRPMLLFAPTVVLDAFIYSCMCLIFVHL